MKHAALTLHALVALLLAWTGYTLFGSLTQRMPVSRVPGTDLRALPEKAIADQRQVADTLGTMARFAQKRLKGGDDIVATSVLAMPARGTPGAEGPLMPQRQLTVRLQSPTGQVAIVDGQLVREGGELPGGGTVVRMQPGTVVVREKNGIQTLTLPTAQMTVGTLRSRAATNSTVTEQRFDAKPARRPAVQP